ncbi:hypothetical protein DFQ28_000446 [Apophysomyces sp. BC1034]|nr:hypothetical protein DFQ29_003969 [Apophysomyces sp. BC1021]KAG0191329.1 hypothetical protein DFQ28_000446 [Apophysomyces sp. BC1034]
MNFWEPLCRNFSDLRSQLSTGPVTTVASTSSSPQHTVITISDVSEEWKKGIKLDGQLAWADAIRAVGEDDSNLIISGDALEYNDHLKVSINDLLMEEWFDANFRMNLSPEVALFRAGAEAGYGKHLKHSENSTKQIHRSVLYISCGEIRLSRGAFEATESLKKEVAGALLLPEDNDIYQALQTIFQKYGYFYPSTILIEGSNEDRMENRRDAGIHIGLGPVELGIGGSSNHLYSKVKAEILQGKNLQAIGGCPHILVNESCELENWTNTIKSKPKIIQYRHIQPLYHLLEDDQRQKIQQIYDGAKHSGVIRYNRILSMKNDYYPVPISVDDLRRVPNYFNRVIPHTGNEEVDYPGATTFQRKQRDSGLV